MPRRPNWDGLMPVPGDGRYEWEGFLRPGRAARACYNPARGWVATANEMNLPPDYPAAERKHRLRVGRPVPRCDRIDEVLSAPTTAMTIADSLALQTDVFSGSALRAIALLRGTDVGPTRRSSRRCGCSRPGTATRRSDSAAAAIAEVWLNKHLAPHHRGADHHARPPPSVDRASARPTPW